MTLGQLLATLALFAAAFAIAWSATWVTCELNPPATTTYQQP